ncbi:MAG TPA: hypothetical protein VK923_07205 [Euzebyales bacterium]|nr:hypothetical protein [Euzebyales bacterium]
MRVVGDAEALTAGRPAFEDAVVSCAHRLAASDRYDELLVAKHTPPSRRTRATCGSTPIACRSWPRCGRTSSTTGFSSARLAFVSKQPPGAGPRPTEAEARPAAH